MSWLLHLSAMLVFHLHTMMRVSAEGWVEGSHSLVAQQWILVLARQRQSEQAAVEVGVVF